MRKRRWIAAVWLILLAASYGVRSLRPRALAVAPGTAVAQVAELDAGTPTGRTVRLAYLDQGPTAQPPAPEAAPLPAIVLLHGSPGGRHDLAGLARALSRGHRVIVPDLPGFGASTHDVADYSIAAHAGTVLELLDALHVERAHVVGFSMGGGVALELTHQAPERVASLTMLSSIGVQEHELLGTYELNHALHGVQLVAIWLATNLLPHFGMLDHWALDLPYARNFYDTDQRPLRGYLRGWAGPALILHGENDPLVAPEAAREHARLMPQSQLVMLPGSHFYVFTQPDMLAAHIEPFLEQVEHGQARTRATAAPGRIAASIPDLDSVEGIRVRGLARFILMGLLVLGALMSEDLAGVAAGFMVAHGRIDFLSAVVGCYVGILAGDLALYGVGRMLGRRVLRRAPWRWLVRPHDMEDARHWYAERGIVAVFLSRFLPGARAATYFVAGLVRARPSVFIATLAVAAALWVPMLVGFAALTGDAAATFFRRMSVHWLPAAGMGLLLVLALVRVLIPLSTWRGRRLLIGGLRRKLQWEFWPLPVFYLPVVAYIAWLALRYRSATVVTAVNPAIPAGGVVGESKDAILRVLATSTPERVAPHVMLPAAVPTQHRQQLADEFMAAHGLTFPVVLKPDVGQRGQGVAVVRDGADLRERIATAHRDLLLQEYVPGVEFGVFYVRQPDQERGRIFSITEKRMPVVVGDGRRDLETLILADERAVCMARTYMEHNAARLHSVPVAGEPVQLVELGTHCRGAIFLDGGRLKTPELEAEIDRVSRGFAGFYFGRYDVRCASPEQLQRGQFRVIELNGLTSEATHIYDPGTRLVDAWKTLCAQWRLAFQIGSENHRRGNRVFGKREVWEMLRGSRRAPAR